MPHKVIIDCDPGVDDALALILGFHSPEIEIVGISGVNGNVSLDKVMRNIQRVLTLIQPRQRPFVARGAERPLKGDQVFSEHVHGDDGLGRARVQPKAGEEWWNNSAAPAPEFLIETASRHPGEITLVAIGPLTNPALALRQDPAGMKKLKQIIVMGGALRESGNITPYAEFNFFVDPLAAQIVLNSGIPITLTPLDVTHRVFLTPEIMEEVGKDAPDPIVRFLIESTGFDFETKKFRGRHRFYLHDPLAVAALIRPDLFRKEKVSVAIETREGDHYGHLKETGGMDAPADQRVDVCVEVDSERFMKLFLSRLTRSANRFE